MYLLLVTFRVQFELALWTESREVQRERCSDAGPVGGCSQVPSCSSSNLTVDGLNTIDVILRECVGAGFPERVVGIHQSTRVRGVRKPQGMTEFMSSNKKQVVI